MHPAFEIPVYAPHPGTVRISGATDCKKAASCALHYLSQGLTVDFFYIGANAGQQAMKAMGILRYILERATDQKTTVLFQPNRVLTETKDRTNPELLVKVDGVYWRAYPMSLVNVQQLQETQHADEPLQAASGGVS